VPPAAPLILLLLVGVHLSTRQAWAWRALLVLAVGLVASGTALGLGWAPVDQYMGELQRIMYVHVPLVWTAMLAAAVTFVASVAYLWSTSPRADALADAAAEVGLVLGTLGVILGSIWGRPTWGVWWTPDPRLNATVVMLLALGANMLARRRLRVGARSIAAVIGCAQALALPLVVLSVRLWNTLHQLPSSAATMDPAMTLTLRWNAVAYVGLFLVLLLARLRAARPQPPAGAGSR
jgi:heme exporter protein C